MSKKTTDTGEKKEPSEKSLYQAKVKDLRKELAAVEKILREQEQLRKSCKERREEEVENNAAVVEHLKKVMSSKSEIGDDVQSRLQWADDVTELTEQRAAVMSHQINRRQEVERNIFQQQHAELGDRLSRLKERSAKRKSQQEHLKKAESLLAEKTSIESRENREQNMNQVQDLLQKRSRFKQLVDDLATDSREVFDLSLPVRAKHQVQDNARARTLCQEAAEDLLVVQDKSSDLKQLQMTLDIHVGTQDSTEERMGNLEAQNIDQLDDLLQGNLVTPSIWTAYLTEMGMNIRNMERQRVAIEEKIDLLKEIVEDQEHYKQSLKKQVEKNQRRTGLLVSKVLRAAEVFKSKVAEVQGAQVSEVDRDVLQEIRTILEEEDSMEEELPEKIAPDDEI